MERKKYKLIIIDDEYVVIKGLKKTINWDELDIEIVAECKNGEDGIKAIKTHKPDLVISDIRMPKLDGLSLARELRKTDFDGAIIIYSGYSDFEYARLAIDYGVTKYILKPVENEVLVRSIKEALLELEQERKKLKALEQYNMGLPFLKENLIEQILSGNNEHEAEQNLKLIGITIPKTGIVIDGACIQSTTKQTSNTTFWTLYDELLDSMKGFNVVGQKYSKGFVLITGLTNVSVIYNYVNEFLEQHTLRADCHISVGISNPYGESLTLREAFNQAKSLRKDYIFSSINNVKTADESIEGKKRKKLVDEALKIISTEYGKKLQVKKIAERLYVSESHLMHEFKDNLGKTFIECLTEYRMMKAKELLKEGSLRINEIAALVGYSDVRYFGMIFKETVGMSPSDYVEKKRKV